MIEFRFAHASLVQTRAFRVLFAASAATHLLVAVLSGVWPELWSSSVRPVPVFVELVAELPAPPAARPEPVPEPAPPEPEPVPEPEPEPPQQVVDEPVVIPEEPRPLPKPKPKPKPEPKVPPPPPLTKEQILARLRSQVGPEPPRSAPTTRDRGAQPTGRLDPLLAAYQARITRLVHAAWTGAKAYRHRSGLEVEFALDLDGAGRVRSVRLLRSSGEAALDASAERALHKVIPQLPAAPRGYDRLHIRFDPRDVS